MESETKREIKLSSQAKDALKELVIYMVKNNKVTFSDVDVSIVGINKDAFKELIWWGIVVTLEPPIESDNYTYTIAPYDLDICDTKFMAFLATNNDLFPKGWRKKDVMLARWFYQRVAVNELVDEKDPDRSIFAWFIGKIVERYNIADEIVDRRDPNSSFTLGSVYYRVGSVWVSKHWTDCLKPGWGTTMNIVRCATYAFNQPPKG